LWKWFRSWLSGGQLSSYHTRVNYLIMDLTLCTNVRKGLSQNCFNKQEANNSLKHHDITLLIRRGWAHIVSRTLKGHEFMFMHLFINSKYLTWKKVSSWSLRTPLLSKSDTLKIRVKARTQADLICERKKQRKLKLHIHEVLNVLSNYMLKCIHTHEHYTFIHKRCADLFLLWTVEWPCRVKNSFLCIVKQLWNILQILGWTL